MLDTAAANAKAIPHPHCCRWRLNAAKCEHSFPWHIGQMFLFLTPPFGQAAIWHLRQPLPYTARGHGDSATRKAVAQHIPLSPGLYLYSAAEFRACCCSWAQHHPPRHCGSSLSWTANLISQRLKPRAQSQSPSPAVGVSGKRLPGLVQLHKLRGVWGSVGETPKSYLKPSHYVLSGWVSGPGLKGKASASSSCSRVPKDRF